MSNYWFISDTHLNHQNIITYCNRPFKNIYQMNDTIIKRWNERVKEGDIVFHLGDFCFKEKMGVKAEHWIEQLNGDIILLKGNHDNNNSAKTIIDSMYIELGGKTWFLSHHPYRSTIEYNLSGHVHNLWKIRREGKQIYINVGVDVWNYRPINIQEITREIGRFKRTEQKKE